MPIRRGPSFERTDEEMSEEHWNKIFELFAPRKNYSFDGRDREQAIFRRLRETHNTPLSESAICALAGVNRFGRNETQTANQIFAMRKVPYRLLKIERGNPPDPHYKIFICKEPATLVPEQHVPKEG